MFFLSRYMMGIALLVGLLLAMPSSVYAQDRSEDALSLVAAAMDAYSNLEMDKAKSLLDDAMALKDTIDDVTLAQVYVGYGVLWAGGYTNTEEAKNSFVTALCLDKDAKVDPLFSTPEIDLSFTESGNMASPAKCRELGVGTSIIPPCGTFENYADQRRGYELPFYIDVDTSLLDYISRISVKYAYDSRSQFRSLELEPMGESGYGAMVRCDQGEIATVNPGSAQFYIEGYDAADNLICVHGNREAPMEVLMGDGVPIVSRPGLSPLGCTDATRKAAGESCSIDSECKTGLVCDVRMFQCQETEEVKPDRAEGMGKGPKKFYVTLTGGVGVGYSAEPIQVTRFDKTGKVDVENLDLSAFSQGAIMDAEQTPKGGLNWSGIPIRLAMGFKINPKLSVEVSGRLDGYVISNSTPVSCWDATGGDLQVLRRDVAASNCSTDISAAEQYYASLSNEEEGLSDTELESIARQSARVFTAGDDSQTVATSDEYQVAWLINARARFQFLTKKALQMSAFGGIGYGHIQYRVKDTSGNDFYSLPGMVDIEIGVGLNWWLTDHVGLVFDIPIDFLVGDSFALNFDFNLGMGFGF